MVGPNNAARWQRGCWSLGLSIAGISVRSESSPVIRNNQIIDNEAGSFGGGIDLSSGCSAEIVDNLFRGNRGIYAGGGL
jgi:hypothetical protein